MGTHWARWLLTMSSVFDQSCTEYLRKGSRSQSKAVRGCFSVLSTGRRIFCRMRAGARLSLTDRTNASKYHVELEMEGYHNLKGFCVVAMVPRQAKRMLSIFSASGLVDRKKD